MTDSLSLDFDRIPFNWESEVMWVIDIVCCVSC